MKKIILVDMSGPAEEQIVGVFKSKKAVNTFLKEEYGISYEDYFKSHEESERVSYDEWLSLNEFYIKELKKHENY